jgi:hypothetical protein
VIGARRPSHTVRVTNANRELSAEMGQFHLAIDSQSLLHRSREEPEVPATVAFSRDEIDGCAVASSFLCLAL